MNGGILTFIIIIILMGFGVYVRKRFAKPKSEDDVQRPGKFNIFILRFIIVLAFLCAIPAVLGLITGELEMGIVFGIMAVVFGLAAVIVKREYDISYQENDEYFILKAKNREYKVFYENIVDWQPGYNEIKVLDESRSDVEYVRVNIAIIKPEILLRTIVEMTFEGRFSRMDDTVLEDSNREREIVNYLVNNGYGYLAEDYIEE